MGQARRHGGAATIAGLACLLTAALPAPGLAAADPRPSAGDVADARRAVRDRSDELGTVTADLAAARARLSDLAVTAERLVETYNGELVRLGQAEAAQADAGRRAALADAQVARARAAVTAIATQSYGGVDLSRPELAMMDGSTGLPGYLHQASVLQHMSGERAEILKRMTEAQEVAAILHGQAHDAYAARQLAARRAETAKAAAQAAVAAQQQQTSAIRREARTLEVRLHQARSRADRMARVRAAALERAKLARQRAQVTKVVKAGRAVRGGSSAQMGDLAANWALSQLGKPYVWAAAGPSSYDCSGLTMRAWQQAGVQLDHWTGTQWTSGPHVPTDSLRRGDLVFFGRITSNPGDIHHVGMYIGDGMMVHAPQTGDVVRVAPIWRSDLVGATRPT